MKRSGRRAYAETTKTTTERLDYFNALTADASAALTDAFPPRLLGDCASLDAVVVPQSADDFAGRHFAHVHADQSHDEHSVTAQIVLGKLGQYAGLALSGVECTQLLAQVLDVAGPVAFILVVVVVVVVVVVGVVVVARDVAGPVERAEQPAQRVDGCDQRQEDVPKPDVPFTSLETYQNQTCPVPVLRSTRPDIPCTSLETYQT